MPTSKISWTDEAWNPYTWNCNKVSPGCKNCYAQIHSEKYPQNSAGGLFLGAPKIREKAFEELRVTKAGTVLFVNTHSDTFHDAVPLAQVQRIFKHMNQRPDLIFLLLTKRPLTAWLLKDHFDWTDNIWLGTSIENMDYYAPRLENLLATPARHKFISFEPLLGAIQPDALLNGVDWAIVGGESGEYRRPMGKQWALELQQWFERAHIPFFYKQGSSLYPDQDRLLNGREYRERPAAFDALHQKYTVQADQSSLF